MIKRVIPAEVMLLIAVMWGIFLIDFVLPGITFYNFGIHPRTLGGLTGILISPFLHGGFVHLFSNTIPLLVLPSLVRLSVGSSKMRFVLIIGVAGSGFGTWLFGLSDIVIGASGLVFALIGYLLADAYFSPSLRSWGIAVISLALYGGALLSLFVFLPYISWAAHFWGLVSGIAIAALFRGQK